MFEENKHPRDKDSKFTDGQTNKTVEAIKKYSDDPERDIEEYENLPSANRLADTVPRNKRIKVGEITSPIYDDMVLSNGRKVKDIVTRAVEMPLFGSVGAEHIEEHPERKGMVEHYIGFMNDIINDPDYVFEDKVRENTILIDKEIDTNVIMTVSLNFDNPKYTNTVITMRHEDKRAFQGTVRNYEKFQKVLYKRSKM